ncbi:MAG TPA: DUF4129 domain-containing protein [Puia sp.]|jgi:hypothetical protein
MTLRRHPGILLLFLSITCLPAAAQQNKGEEQKADTVMADTIVVGAESPVEKTHLDTSFAPASELGNTTPSVDQPPLLRRLPDTTVYRWQHDPKYAYANDPDYWKVQRERPGAFWLWLGRLLSSKGFRYTILTLLGALLLYAIVRIAMDNNLGAFYRRGRRIKRSDGTDVTELEQEDIDQQLQHYLSIGDRRQATRYLYLKSLHLLSERSLINWHADTTNHEYLRQLRGVAQEPSFRWLTNAYEMVWYGDFVLSESSFRVLHERFLNFYKTLGA